ILVGAVVVFGSFGWRARHVSVVNVSNVFVNRSGVVNRPGLVSTGQLVIWQQDPGDRRGVPYHIASLQERFGASTQAGQRRDFRWQDPAPATRNSSLNRPEVHSANPRPQMQGIERPYPRRDGRPDGRSSANP